METTDNWFNKLCEAIVDVCGKEQISWPDKDRMFWKMVRSGGDDSFFFDVSYDPEFDAVKFRSWMLNSEGSQIQMMHPCWAVKELIDEGILDWIVRKFTELCWKAINDIKRLSYGKESFRKGEGAVL